jgi:hypothetical protein
MSNSQLAVCVSTGILHSSSFACVFKHNAMDALSGNYFSKIQVRNLTKMTGSTLHEALCTFVVISR